MSGIFSYIFWVLGFGSYKLMVFGFLGLTYLGVPRFFRSQVLRVSGSWDLGFLILGFCGLRVRFFESFLGVGFLVLTIFLRAQFRFLLLTLGLFNHNMILKTNGKFKNIFHACMTEF